MIILPMKITFDPNISCLRALGAAHPFALHVPKHHLCLLVDLSFSFSPFALVAARCLRCRFGWQLASLEALDARRSEWRHLKRDQEAEK